MTITPEALFARVLGEHPVTVTRRCGNRLSEPSSPPPGPASPPVWCQREADHDGGCVDPWGRFLRPIEERPPVVTYRCETCRTQQDHHSETPCATLAALAAALSPVTL